MSANLHISISAEPVFHLGNLAITNSILTSLIVSTLIISFAVAVNWSLTIAKSTKKIGTLQNLAEFLVEGLYNLIQSVTNDHTKTRRFMPLIVAYFVFILCNNWFGLLPGVGTIGFKEVAEGEEQVVLLQQDLSLPVAQVQASETKPLEVAEPNQVSNTTTEIAETNVDSEAKSKSPVFVPYFRAGTADLNTTIALAMITQFAAQFWGLSYLKFDYIKKFINFSSPIMFFVGILELVGEFSKVMSYAFRLFGNIFAGEVLLTVISALVPLVVPMAFYGLEIFVGAIQAFVFSLLSIIFYQVATLGHHYE
ncbi:MAG TPA: ATP synthase F0 subunit A [Candidatus Pacebacteria bacterium]|nr:ATP synthase F0 subunit A [Candidatus Paceibacterota bacterium]